MPQASDVVEVNVRFGDAVIDSVDLSTVLGYVYHAYYADLVRTYDASSWAEIRLSSVPLRASKAL